MSLNIEALAQYLAEDDVQDWIMGDRWYGWPDDENEEQMTEAVAALMPAARKRAERYVKILLGRDA